MNRGELRSALLTRLKIPVTGDPRLDPSTLNLCIDHALRDVSGASDWPWLLTTTALTFTNGVAPLPTTLVKVRELVVNSYRAKYVDLAEFLDTVSLGDRWVWTTVGTNAQLSPVPATSPTNTLYFIRAEPDLTTDTQSPLVPEAHQAAVLSRASYHAEIARSRAEAATFHNNEYETDLRRMRDATKTRTGPRQIRSAGERLSASW